MNITICKGLALATIFVGTAACVSGKPAGRLSYFHNASKTADSYQTDISHCTKIAFEEGRHVSVPIEHPKGPGGTEMVEMRGVYGPQFSFNPLTMMANSAIAGYEETAEKYQNLNKCMFLRGYDSYYVSAEMDRKVSSYNSDERSDWGKKMAVAKEPYGTHMPWPEIWKR